MVMSLRGVDVAPGYVIDCYGGVSGPKRMLRPVLKPRGYQQVSVKIRGKQRAILVHRLVADAFLPNASEEVNHKDTDKTNNAWHNLEWVTSSWNKLHATAHGLYPTGPEHYRYRHGRTQTWRQDRRDTIRDLYKGTT